MTPVKTMYDMVRDNPSVTIAVLSSYLLSWVFVAKSDPKARPGPLSWLCNYITDLGIAIPGWIQKILLSSSPHIMLLMLLASLSLAYCSQLLPAILIASIQWHGLGPTFRGYLLLLFTLSVLTGLVARMGVNTLSASYVVQVKVLFPGFAIPLYPLFLGLGIIDKFIKPSEGPHIPSDLDLLEGTALTEFTGADLVRALRIASDSGYMIPPKARPPVSDRILGRRF